MSPPAPGMAPRAGGPGVPPGETESGSVGIPARLRLALQHQAPAILRRHVVRALTRFLVLVAADLAAFGVLREVIRSVRDYALLGDGVGGAVQSTLPGGHLNGWQYAAALFVGLVVTGNYGTGDRRRDAGRMFAGVALATALPLWDGVWNRELQAVLVQYGITLGFVWAALVAERFGVDAVVQRLRSGAEVAGDVLFVGPAEDCRRAAASPAFGPGSEYRRVGFVDVTDPPAPGALGQLRDLPLLLAASGADAVVVCGRVGESELREVVDAALASGCQVLTMPRVIGMPGVQAQIVWRRGQAIVELTAPTLRGWQLAVKRGMDVVGSMIGLLWLSPGVAVVAALIKLDSSGPVFFTQERVGQGGRRFRIIKFRTMVVGADAHRDGLAAHSVYRDGRLFKVPEDPRVTRVGRWLRRTSLDEVPQLANVLRGSMSLVGPRPPIPREVDLYERHHYSRFDVKPGMTGPWQVAGRNDITDFEQVIRLETKYIRHWSIWLDVAILLRTAWVVLRMRGAH